VHDFVDLRSDTMTQPTPEMREAMARAEVGDDVWDEDPTVKRLEAMAAARVGKESALFVSSGTMGNLLCVLAQTHSGQEVVLDLDSHVFNSEVGGAAVIGGVQMLPLKTERGFLTPDQVKSAVRPANIHIAPTGLVCLENTHNRHGGTCSTPEEIAAVAAVAHAAGVPVHLDGARLFNAAVALKRDAREFVQHVDSVTFCLEGAERAGGLAGLRLGGLRGPRPALPQDDRRRHAPGGYHRRRRDRVPGADGGPAGRRSRQRAHPGRSRGQDAGTAGRPGQCADEHRRDPGGPG